MPVPADIRAVKRPVNTVVINSGTSGPLRYSVRERARSVYVPGKNPQPRNGKVIGHIDPVTMTYVPIQQKTASCGPEFLSYGASELACSISSDIRAELSQIIPLEDVYKAMPMAIVKATRQHATARRISSEYRRSFVCRHYPGAALSPNTIGSFLEKLGMDGQKRRDFYRKRADAVVAEHHIAIDGTLKQDTSTVNTLSAFSYKARTRGRKEISIIYAYDIEEMEPICAKVFPGNCIDASAYAAFIRENNLTRGIIVADKGFPPSMIAEELKARPDLYFLTPLERNDVRIRNNDMLSFDGVLSGVGRNVAYRKVSLRNGRFLYSFQDAEKEGTERGTFFAKARRSGEYDKDKFLKKQGSFGVIVFESDQDLPPEAAFACYEDRWLLEMVFDSYKNDLDLDQTNVQGDFSVIGAEFINFIASVITCRILNKARKAGVLAKMTYGEMMEALSGISRRVDAPDTPPSSDDGYWVNNPTKEDFELLEALGLSTPAPKPEPKKRGRPRKSPEAQESQPKRPRGRPRVRPLPPPDAPKRPRGRPRKNPLPEEGAPKKPRGRPRKNPPAKESL